MTYPEEPSDKGCKADTCVFPVRQDDESLHPDKFSNLQLFNPEFYHLSCNPSEALAT
jgi:hypothetical protein